MGAGFVNVDIGSILNNAKGIGDGIKSVLTGIRTLITGKEPIDPTKLAEIEATLAQVDALQQNNQVEINKIEAASSSWWVAGWRPYIGWICGTAMAVYFLPMFIIGTYLWARQVIVTGTWITPPDLGIGQVISLVASMLGLAVLRSFEKDKGVQNSH
jgi:hypothetical protein